VAPVSTIRLALVPNPAPDEDMVLMPRRGISVVAIITRGPMSSSSSGVGAVALELAGGVVGGVVGGSVLLLLLIGVASTLEDAHC